MVCPFLNTWIYYVCELQIKGITFCFVLLQAHPWFEGMEWDKLYQMEAAFIPEVNDELDTQNFEKFEEVLASLFRKSFE